MTTEAMIAALCGLESVEETKIISSANGYIVVDELSTLIDRNSFKSGMIAVLTKLYDCEDFEYSTRARGTESINNPCLSILGASTLHWIKEAIPIVAIGGGFTSRIIFVFKDKADKLIPWPVILPGAKQLLEDIGHDLSEVAKMRGQMNLTDATKDIFKKEYVRFFEKSSMFDSPTLSGYAGRRHMSLLKVAMLLSIARTDSREIDEEDMLSAIKALEWAEQHMPKIMRAISAEECGTLSEEVLMVIMGRKRISRSDLLKAMRHKLYPEQLDVIVDALDQINAINIESEGNRLDYVFIGKHND